MEEAIDLSIILPVKDEEKSIPILVEEIESAMRPTNLRFECIWVDDGSTDASFEVIKKMHSQFPHHCYVRLKQNYGQSAAMIAGCKIALGKWIATIDTDLQNDPADILKLLEILKKENVGMVNGIRLKRNDNFIRRVSSIVGNRFKNWIVGDRTSDVGSMMRVFERKYIEDVVVFKGLHKFLPDIARLQGCKIIEAPIHHRPRLYGKTKYWVWNRLWVGLMDCFAIRWFKRRNAYYEIKEISQ